MPALSFLTMRNRVALNLGNMQSSHPFYGQLGAYVNDALNKLPLHAVNQSAHNFDLFPELHAKWTNISVQDQAWLPLPSDCLAVQQVFSFDSSSVPDVSTTDRKPVSLVSPSDYELLPKASTITGYPRIYTIEGLNLYLHPTPRAGYTTYILAKGLQQEPELSADASTPIMDKRWHSAIVDYASYLLATDLGWQEDAARFLANCDQKISTAVSLIGLSEKLAPIVVQANGVS